MKQKPTSLRSETEVGSLAVSGSLHDNLRALRLGYMEEHAVRAAREAALEGRGHLDFLEELVAAEAAKL